MPPHMPTQCTPERNPVTSIAAGSAQYDNGGAGDAAKASNSDDLRVALALACGAQVAVEHHAHRTHQQPAARRDHDPVRLQLDQALVRRDAQVVQFAREVLL